MTGKKQKFPIPDDAKTRALSDKYDIPYSEVVSAYLKFGPKRTLRALEKWLNSLRKVKVKPSYDTLRMWSKRFDWKSLSREYDKVYHQELVKAIDDDQDAKDKAKLEAMYSKQGRAGRPLQTPEEYPYQDLGFKKKSGYNERQDLIDTAEITLFSLRQFVKRNRIMSWQDAERACKMAQEMLVLAEKLVGTVTAKRAEENAKPTEAVQNQAQDKYSEYMSRLNNRANNLNGGSNLN